jgi:hypothetical protein
LYFVDLQRIRRELQARPQQDKRFDRLPAIAEADAALNAECERYKKNGVKLSFGFRRFVPMRMNALSIRSRTAAGSRWFANVAY